MAKITVEGTVYEGTAEELREIFEMMGVEFPAVKAEEDPLKVGDYAKVVGGDVHCYSVGDIVKVEDISYGSSRGSKECVRLSDRIYQTVYGKDLIRATDEEVAEAKAKLEVSEKWAKIGRKPNEFMRGDIVEVTGEKQGNKYYGEIGGISKAFEDERYYFHAFGATKRSTEKVATIKLLSPAEARFDLA